MSELVTSLRDHAPGFHHGTCMDCHGTVMDDAADEIERLQKKIYEMKMSLGVLCALMESDISRGYTMATPGRTEEITKARVLSRPGTP